MAAVCTNDAERLTNIGPHARIDLDPRFDASAASCEFCARFNNSVRRCGSGNNISRDGQAPSDAMLRRPCDVSPGEDCALCTQAPTRPAWVRARTAGFLGENIQAHLLRLKAKSKALQLFPKREQNELHRSDSFKFQRYERDREAQLAPKIIVDDEYALPVDLIVRYTEEDGRRQIYLPTVSSQPDLHHNRVGLLGNYCDPLDCKSYVDPGEAEKIYLCDESHRGEDHNGCDNTYIQPESCQVKDPETCSSSAGKGKENCVRIEVQSCNRGKPSGEFERKVGIRLSPSTAHVFQKRLQARIDGSDVGNREPGCTPGVPFYENVTWVAVTPPTSVSESTDDDDQLSCEEGEFVIDLPCFCQAAAADVKPSSHTSHPSLYRSHSALVLSVPCHSNGCAESANNCWCLASDGILVPNLIGKPPLPHGVARGSNMCFRQTVDPEDDVYCVFRVPGAPDGSCQGADQSFACNASGGQGPNQTPPPGKDAQRRATKPGLRSLLLRQSHPKRLFLSPAKPGRVYCPNGDVVRSKNYFSSSRHATQQQQQPSKDAVPESKEVVFTKQTTAKNGAIPPLASSTPVKTCGSPRNVMKSNGCCDSPTASVSGVRVKCNSFARSASFGNGHTAECVATEPPKFLEAPKGPSQAYLTSEASSSGSSSQISSLESVRSSGSSSNNGTHQSGVYSTYLNQRAVLNGGSPIQNATEIHIDSKPSPPAVKQCGERPSLCLNHKRNTWIAAVPHGCDSGGEINFDDLAALPFEMPKLQRKLEQMKRHSWNDGDSMLAPSQRYAKSIPTIDEPEHKSSADLEGILSSNRASPGRPQRRSDLHLMLSVGNQELPHIDVDLPLQRQGWFHGAISRKDAEHLLRMTKEGSFLVRNSESSQKGFSLSLKSPRGFMHMRISEQKKGEYVLGEFSKPFTNIPDMVYHYVRNRLPIKGAEHMSLRYPIIEQLL